MNGYYQKQAQVPKQAPLSKTDRKQVLVNDLVGRLLADVERAIQMLGGHCQSRYSHFSLNSSLGLRETMLNLEITTSGIVAMLGQEVRGGPLWMSKTVEASLPRPNSSEKAYLEHLYNSVEVLAKKPEFKAHRQILRHTIGSLLDGVLTELPEDLTSKIVSHNSREEVCKDFVKNRPGDVMSIQCENNHHTDHTENILSNGHYLDKNPTYPQQPLPTSKDPKKNRSDEYC